MSLEQHLLIASGLMAIGLVALVSALNGGLWPGLAVHLAFATAFLMSAYKDRLVLLPEQGAIGVVTMAPLSALALMAYQDTIVLILSVVLMASAPYHLSRQQCWLLMLAINLSYGGILSAAFTPSEYGVGWLTLIALQSFAVTTSLARQREKMTQETLARQNNELLAARAVMAQQSQAEERLRIAGDLHDTIGHRLTALQLQLEILSHEAPSHLADQVTSIQGLARDLLEDIRSIVRKMSEEKRGDLASAIGQLEELTPGVEVSITSELPKPDTALAQQLVFCFQEGISNAIRHGGATKIEISYDDEGFSIRDNGRGLNGPVSPGFGLANIGQRLAPFGGKAHLEGHEERGCELLLAVPGAAP